MLPIAILATTALSQDPSLPPDGFQFTGEVRVKVKSQYLVALPEGYNPKSRRRWPVLLFLHGSGERGSDLEKVRVHGPLKEIKNGRKIPMIVVAPQCPEGEWWNTATLAGLLDHIEKTYRVDKDRVYLSGLSMGGYGTFELALAQPHRFAAIAPICGGGNRFQAKTIKHLPTWVVHGDADGAVPIQNSQDMVDAMRAAGANVRFDIIKGGGHDVWTDFYAKSEFYDWLLTHRRGESHETNRA